MPRTELQIRGDLAEKAVCRYCTCPKCKKPKKIAKLRILPESFKCADIICDFCGFLAQVKGTNAVGKISRIRGAGWNPQKEKMDAGIFFPLYIVRIGKHTRKPTTIYYVAADFLKPETFVRREATIRSEEPAGKPRKHAMFDYDFRLLDQNAIIRVWPTSTPSI